MQLWISYISFHRLTVVDLVDSFWVTTGCLTLLEILDSFWATITNNGSPYATGLLSCLTVTMGVATIELGDSTHPQLAAWIFWNGAPNVKFTNLIV